MVKKLPRDLDIFSLFTRMAPACIQVCTNLWPVAHSDWAISFSWCGNSRSGPPPWMSKVSPRHLVDMAEHSMCQPGRPSPQGERRPGWHTECSAMSTTCPGDTFEDRKSTRLNSSHVRTSSA